MDEILNLIESVSEGFPSCFFIVAKTDYNYGTVSGIIHNQLNMRRICARWIPKMLNTDQKRLRVECCEQLLKRLEREREKFMDRIVTVDDT